MTDIANTSQSPARFANGRFGPGNPGRRPGSRNRASHRAVMAILQDFETNHDAILERLREDFTPTYFAVLCRLLASQAETSPPSVAEISDLEVAETLDRARAALAGAGDGRRAP